MLSINVRKDKIDAILDLLIFVKKGDDFINISTIINRFNVFLNKYLILCPFLISLLYGTVRLNGSFVNLYVLYLMFP